MVSEQKLPSILGYFEGLLYTPILKHKDNFLGISISMGVSLC